MRKAPGRTSVRKTWNAELCVLLLVRDEKDRDRAFTIVRDALRKARIDFAPICFRDPDPKRELRVMIEALKKYFPERCR